MKVMARAGHRLNKSSALSVFDDNYAAKYK
jgi:hypothetical protein